MCIVSVVLATVVIFLVAKVVRDRPSHTEILAPVLQETEADPPAANTNLSLNDSSILNLSSVSLASAKSLELPQFYDNNPTLWFKIIKASFGCCDVTDSKEQYDLTLRALRVKQLQQIEHLLSVDQQPNNAYEVLKQTLLKENSMSDNERLDTMLHDVHLGSSRPTEMLRK